MTLFNGSRSGPYIHTKLSLLTHLTTVVRKTSAWADLIINSLYCPCWSLLSVRSGAPQRAWKPERSPTLLTRGCLEWLYGRCSHMARSLGWALMGARWIHTIYEGLLQKYLVARITVGKPSILHRYCIFCFCHLSSFNSFLPCHT